MSASPHGRLIAGKWVSAHRVEAVLAGQTVSPASIAIARKTRGPNKPKTPASVILQVEEVDPFDEAVAATETS